MCLAFYCKSKAKGKYGGAWNVNVQGMREVLWTLKVFVWLQKWIALIKPRNTRHTEELVGCKESVSLHKAVQSNQVFGPQPYSSQAIKLPQAARDLSAETFWVYFSSHKILHYFLSVLELCLSIFNPKQQKQPTYCILGWNNIDCLQERHLNSLDMHSICYSKCYCKVEYFQSYRILLMLWKLWPECSVHFILWKHFWLAFLTFSRWCRTVSRCGLITDVFIN